MSDADERPVPDLASALLPAPAPALRPVPEADRRVAAVCVVVPVHDEQELLGRCISALRHAVAHEAARPGGVRVEVVLVLDGCTDASGEIARRSPFHVVEVSERRVGAARGVGVDVALAALHDHPVGVLRPDSGSRAAPRDRSAVAPIPIQIPLDRVWIASTDADSAVPPRWVSSQVGLADSGADVVVGTVRPDPADLTSRQRSAWQTSHVSGQANGHVHGANLGMRADVYVRAGGYPHWDEHEDVALVARARDAGARVVASDDAWVLTSGRQQGRTPGGYARFLREDLVGGPPA